MKRSAVTLALVVVCTTWLVAAFAQAPQKESKNAGPGVADGAIVVGEPMAQSAGRFELETVGTSGVAVIDTRTGQVWVRQAHHLKWQDWGSPAERD